MARLNDPNFDYYWWNNKSLIRWFNIEHLRTCAPAHLQLAKFPRVLYAKPSNMVYVYHQRVLLRSQRMMGRLGLILSNIQRFSNILIGCIFYGMV